MSEPLVANPRDKRVFHTPSPSALGIVGIEEMCGLLRVSRPTLERLINDPDENFPTVFRIGKRHYARMADLKKWVNSKGRSE